MMGSYLALYAAGVYGYFATKETSYLLLFLAFAGCMHIFFGIFLSLFNRFVFLFRPHLKEKLHNKYTLSIIVLIHVACDALMVWGAESSVDLHRYTTYTSIDELMLNETGHTFDKWLETGDRFLYVSEFEGRLRAFSFIILCVLIVIFFTLIGIVIWFTVNVFVFKRTSKTMSSNSADLLMTVLVQTGSCLFFVFIPAIVMLACWTFAIDGSGNAVNVLLLLFSVNGTADMIAMLYFLLERKLYNK
uniref:G_PROTEIN_RECEP_F1_2 domain-containing protein n=1 Tax=Panagrellus redivivus TaxID=6233 RepID=A0A7E4VCM9_PANRE